MATAAPADGARREDAPLHLTTRRGPDILGFAHPLVCSRVRLQLAAPSRHAVLVSSSCTVSSLQIQTNLAENVRKLSNGEVVPFPFRKHHYWFVFFVVDLVFFTLLL